LQWQEIGEAFDDLDIAKVIERGVNQLDRTIVDQQYAGRGSKPFDPIPLLKMALYQYLKGNQSPGKWFEEAKLNQAMRWRGRGYTPGKRTWYEFRDRASKFIEEVHQQLIRGAMHDKLLEASVGVQDGTSIAASASRHRMVNQTTLEKRRKQLEAIVEETFEGEWPKWVPPTHSGRNSQGNRLNYVSRCRKQRHSNQVLWESRYASDPSYCSACPLAQRCLRPGSKSRIMKRLEGEELMEAHRKKMESPEAQGLYALRGQTVELSFADSKGNRRWDRFHGRGTNRTQAETGLAVVAQNILRLDRLRRARLKPSDSTT
jgi:transposase